VIPAAAVTGGGAVVPVHGTGFEAAALPPPVCEAGRRVPQGQARDGHTVCM